MVIMHHIFGVEKSDGKKEQRTSTMIAYGDPQGYSAMAKTVGLPAAIAAEMILNGMSVAHIFSMYSLKFNRANYGKGSHWSNETCNLRTNAQEIRRSGHPLCGQEETN